jgi:hypothetical protein
MRKHFSFMDEGDMSAEAVAARQNAQLNSQQATKPSAFTPRSTQQSPVKMLQPSPQQGTQQSVKQTNNPLGTDVSLAATLVSSTESHC